MHCQQAMNPYDTFKQALSINRLISFSHHSTPALPPASPTQDMKPITTSSAPFPKNKAKTKLRAKTRAKTKAKTKLRAKTEAKIKARLNSEPKKKATLLSLPPELLLNIADYFLDDYLSWRNGYPSTYRGKLPQLDLFRSCTSHKVQYINLARMHPVFWNLLKGRKLSDAVLKEAKAKARARRESWLQSASDMDDYDWGPLWAAF